MSDNNEIRLNLLTFEECEVILKQLLSDEKVSGVLKRFKIVPATEHTGFLGEYYHLKLNYEVEQEERETRLFVKTKIYQNAEMNAYMEKIGMMKKEANLYKTLINELKQFSPNLWCAKCYYTRDDLFVMQNIEDLGYQSMKDQTRFLSESELRPILKGLATLHASSMAYERLHKVTIGVQLRKYLKEMSVVPGGVWWNTGLKAVLAVAATHPMGQADPQAQRYIQEELPRRLDNVYNMVHPSPLHRNVFCHRDAWGGNIFYHKTKPETEGCVFVDFQLCGYQPPAIDFLMASYMNVEPAERREMNDRCMAHYYKSLTEELRGMDIDVNEELSWAAFQRSVADFALFGAAYNCIAATILRLPQNYLKQLKEERPADFHRYCNVDRTAEVLRLIKENSNFRSYIYDCISDLLELTYLSK